MTAVLFCFSFILIMSSLSVAWQLESLFQSKVVRIRYHSSMNLMVMAAGYWATMASLVGHFGHCLFRYIAIQ